MQYDLRIEDVSPIRRRLHITVESAQVQGELTRALREYKNKVKLPGFRPGKVPQNLIEARFGKQIKSEVSGRIIDRTYRLVVDKLDVAGQPALEDSGEIEAGNSFTFVIGVDVKPAVTVSGYHGVVVPYVVPVVSEVQVDAAVASRVRSQSRIVEVQDDRPVQSGDLVLTSLTLKDGESVVAEEPGTMVHTTAERYYPGVEALLMGQSKGSKVTGSVTIGAGAVRDELRGQTLTLEAEILAIQAQVAPALSDELAAELGFEGGADGMRLGLRAKLQETADEGARNQSRVDLLQKLVELNPFDVPAGMVDEQLQALVEELRVRRAWTGQDPRSIRFTDAEIADLRQRAMFAAKASCILAAVAELESIAVGDDDIDAKIREIADMRGQAVEAIRGYLEKENAFPVLRTRILEEKTLEWLLEQAKLEALDAAPAAEAPAKAPAKASKAKAKAADEAAPAPVEAAPVAAAPAAAAEWNAKMKKDDLLAIAQGRGLDVNSKMKKEELVAALEAAG